MKFFSSNNARRRAAARTVALAFALASANALPVPAAAQTGTVTPPARTDVRLNGNVLATLRVATHAQCEAECRRVAGCTGYNFSATDVAGTLPMPNRVPGKALPNCTLLAGALSDGAARNVVSCRMPCDASAPAPGPRTLPDLAHRTPVLRVPPTTTIAPAAPPPAQRNDGKSSDGKAPAPPPPSAPPPPPPAIGPVTIIAPIAPPLQLARSGVRGWEVVTGAPVQIAPLSSATAVAQCPAGKVALSAGHLTRVNVPDANFGIEVRGAMPDGDVARVFVRNANVGQTVTLRAQAVCITPMAGLRAIDIGRQTIGNRALQLETVCQPNERVIGGGAMASIDALLPANAPVARSDGAVAWRSSARKASPLAGWQQISQARVLCAPEHLVDGWEHVVAPDALLGARSRTDIDLRCSTGTRVLATGLQYLPPDDAVVFTTGDDDFGTPAARAAEDGLSTQLQVGGSNAVASVLNRNTVGAANGLRMRLSAVCARPG